ncbi:unnamed protein product [Rotaria sordida]|uniref:Uncharacterized protein n=1 Tax=Rotaria sordida TaxID=392033 RepID=A0A815N688_9BILA|nr:unnamed protein product [Rotaria sordida]CAF1427729.1 unnamed protein product [Rotaria sordida]
MASSSSPNKSPIINTKLQNNYFFYGTHPLKVPNTLIHSNSTASLSTSNTTVQNSTHLSLDLANSHHNNFRHGYSSTTDLTTTKSLHNLANSRKDDDDNNEVKKTNKKKKKKFIYI